MIAKVNSPDIGSGVIFIAFGAAGFFFGRGLESFAFGEIGPGLFPRIVSGLLVLVGVLVVLKGLRQRQADLGPVPWRALALVTAGVLGFALLIERLGLAAAIVVAVALSGAAAADLRRPRRAAVEIGVLMIVLAAACSLIFAVALGLPVRVWPG